MCETFAGQAPSEYAFETRSMRLNGHCTSIRLEAAFWRALEDMAADDGTSLGAFVSTLHAEVIALHGEAANFTSLLRCACLIYRERRDVARMAAE